MTLYGFQNSGFPMTHEYIYNKGLQPLVFEATFTSAGEICQYLFMFLTFKMPDLL